MFVDQHFDSESDDALRSAQRPLDDTERALLDFEAGWHGDAEKKADEVRTRFGLSTVRYEQMVNALIDNPAALARNPVLMHRLERLRRARRRTVQESTR